MYTELNKSILNYSLFLSKDGRDILKKAEEIREEFDIDVIIASDTTLLPENYLQTDFLDDDKESEERQIVISSPVIS